jgi:hypothetical protein
MGRLRGKAAYTPIVLFSPLKTGDPMVNKIYIPYTCSPVEPGCLSEVFARRGIERENQRLTRMTEYFNVYLMITQKYKIYIIVGSQVFAVSITTAVPKL